MGFNLSIERFQELSIQNCFYCGCKPTNMRQDTTKMRKGVTRQFLNGIDRIDNNIGYIEGNVRACCEDCNKAKRNLSEEQFFDLIKSIYRNLFI